MIVHNVTIVFRSQRQEGCEFRVISIVVSSKSNLCYTLNLYLKYKAGSWEMTCCPPM